ncbi:unnamed protein product [Nyctereutes procyonoides]|uniref:Large ribosomal subunit protein eL38 n=1 Tax=Nyctereutes procyonoides TaxID=34880 RepID=A0A811YQT6_NYCPR|nr:unnamed protein product [Nyctereutes procyonoides]
MALCSVGSLLLPLPLPAGHSDAKSVKIKKNQDNVKLKVQGSRYLYTSVIMDREKAGKPEQSLGPPLQQ